MNDKPINVEDVVEVLSGCTWGPLVGSRGVVQQSLRNRQALVRFMFPKRWQNPEDIKEIIQTTDWLIEWGHLKVLDSAFGNSVSVLESQLEILEDDLVVCRSCLAMSEEMRDIQANTIDKLIAEIDQLKCEIYKLKGH